jgi:hypothetical protein
MEIIDKNILYTPRNPKNKNKKSLKCKEKPLKRVN